MSKVVEYGMDDGLVHQDEFRLRMEKQCIQINKYRRSMLRECGRLLSPDEAALEWIERYAATFDSDALGS